MIYSTSYIQTSNSIIYTLTFTYFLPSHPTFLTHKPTTPLPKTLLNTSGTDDARDRAADSGRRRLTSEGRAGAELQAARGASSPSFDSSGWPSSKQGGNTVLAVFDKMLLFCWKFGLEMLGLV